MKPIGFDSPWLEVEADRPFEQRIVESWADAARDAAAMLGDADVDGLHALCFRPGGLSGGNYRLRLAR